MVATRNFFLASVLLGMVLSLLLSGYPPRVGAREWPSWAVPVLVFIGTGVAAYLSFIEVTHGEAFCGPVGDCNAVQNSKYAMLFGVLPVGVVGLAGYSAMIIAWVIARYRGGSLSIFANIALLAMALFGTLFAIYLTFLEPFVIGATCAWCLASAVIMTACSAV